MNIESSFGKNALSSESPDWGCLRTSDEARPLDDARAIEDALYEDAETCDTLQTARYRELTYKRVRNGYRFFFVHIAGINIIYAIYHQREDWQNLVSDRHIGLDDA